MNKNHPYGIIQALFSRVLTPAYQAFASQNEAAWQLDSWIKEYIHCSYVEHYCCFFHFPSQVYTEGQYFGLAAQVQTPEQWQKNLNRFFSRMKSRDEVKAFIDLCCHVFQAFQCFLAPVPVSETQMGCAHDAASPPCLALPNDVEDSLLALLAAENLEDELAQACFEMLDEHLSNIRENSEDFLVYYHYLAGIDQEKLWCLITTDQAAGLDYRYDNDSAVGQYLQGLLDKWRREDKQAFMHVAS